MDNDYTESLSDEKADDVGPVPVQSGINEEILVSYKSTGNYDLTKFKCSSAADGGRVGRGV